MNNLLYPQCNQDLHIHTIFSTTDTQIVPEQTLELIASIRHAKIIGISDHLDMIEDLDLYRKTVRKFNFHLGVEIDGAEYVDDAIAFKPDYFVYHCYNRISDYKGAEKLLSDGKPVIIAHPNVLGTNLKEVNKNCYIEINNRYIWRDSAKYFYEPHVNDFKFVFSSDAHQPNWLNQIIAKKYADKLGIKETIIF